MQFKYSPAGRSPYSLASHWPDRIFAVAGHVAKESDMSLDVSRATNASPTNKERHRISNPTKKKKNIQEIALNIYKDTIKIFHAFNSQRFP